MTHETKIDQLYKRIQLAAVIITLIVTVGSIVVGYFSLTIANKLAPLSESQSVLTERVQAIDERTANNISRDEFAQVLKRLDYISERVDKLIFIK